ncbi:hypothetical protein [Pedobacter paludis]|uniref:Uncharacterized protein n=1 Tax=Pedobacter paludis TaxID=2203212 RepID=A0A317F2C8_9SPHI|nr:hypothetical protein [Pedobacter paludis]PWS32197.1 hypothetical protein DF947_10535 [Pedobacter paludis]
MVRKSILDGLWNYILENNPDLMFSLQCNGQVECYLREKTDGIMPLAVSMEQEGAALEAIVKNCLETLTRQLRPSKYLYMRDLMKSEFPREYTALREAGVLTQRVILMIDACKEIFEAYDFSMATESDRFLRYAVTQKVSSILNTHES